MGRVVLNWKQNGAYDFFNVYRSLSPMSVDSMPTPLASEIHEKTFTDHSVVVDEKYYYRVAVSRNNTLKFGDEVDVVASNDPNAAYIVNELNFNDQTLFDSKASLNWTATGSNRQYVLKDESYALKLNGSTFINSPQSPTATTSNPITLTFDVWLESTTPQLTGLFMIGNVNQSLHLFRYGGGSGLSLTFANYGSGWTEELPFSTPTNTKLSFRIIKGPGYTRVYVNNILAINKASSSAFSGGPLSIGKHGLGNLAYSLIGSVDNIKLYIGVAIQP